MLGGISFGVCAASEKRKMNKHYIWLALYVLAGTLAGVAAAAYMAKSSTAATAATAPAAG
jgi:flagellar basal body-associated protein FliL